jgi:TolB protein
VIGAAMKRLSILCALIAFNAATGAATNPVEGLAYVSIRTGDAQIFVRNAQGVERAITGGKGINTQPAWSGRGKIAFTSRVGAYTKIFVINEDGSGRAQLTADERMEVAPSWSPDGKSISFLSMSLTTGVVELRLLDLDTQATVIVTGGGVSKGPASAQWSADGRRLCFLASDGSREKHVWVVERDGTGLRNVSIKFAPRGAGWASLSPDGSQVAWSADLRERATHIVVTAIDSGESKDLTPDVTAGHESPRWSPDGKQIVFASTRDDPGGSRTDVFVMDADGRNVRNLSHHPGENFDPKWTANGRHIVFASLRTGTSLLYEVDLVSGITQPLTNHKSHDMDHVIRPMASLR